MELYKSSIPAKYGGRLASVLDVTAREGNKEKIAGSAGIGLLTSRINIEGPIIRIGPPLISAVALPIQIGF